MKTLSRDALVWLLQDPETKKPVLLDVREPSEFNEDKIEGAINIPLGRISPEASEIISDHRAQIVVYCAKGPRAESAALQLERLGFRRVMVLEGGLESFRERKPKSTNGPALSPNEKTRYARQLNLPGFGERAQTTLRSSTALLLGAGGLGSPVAFYLAGAGVGTIRIADPENVELSNLHRQILHTTASIAQPKVESARRAIRELNPGVQVDAILERATDGVLPSWLRGASIVIDATDDLATKRLVARHAMMARVPFVYGSMHRWEVQVAVFHPDAEGCFQCLFPTPPPALPTCADTGVLGAVCGVGGSWMAALAVQTLAGIRPDPHLLVIDTRNGQVHKIAWARDPDCSVCGPTRYERMN